MPQVKVYLAARQPRFQRTRFILAVLLVQLAAALIWSAMPRTVVK